MSRLASKEKMGYYRCPPSVIELIASQIDWTGQVHLCDPFSGKGEALKELSLLSGVDCVIWGNELNTVRYEHAKKQLDHAIFGPAEYCELEDKDDGFPILLYNPPYDSIQGQRLEVEYLNVAARLLRPGGVLVAVIPENISRQHSWAFTLNNKFVHLETCKFPHPEYDRFKQVVVFSTRRQEGITGKVDEALKIMELVDENMSVLKPNMLNIALPKASNPVIVNNTPVSLDLAKTIKGSSLILKTTWKEAIEPSGGYQFRPLAKPQRGHAALLLAAGLVDGISLGEWLLKGYSYKYLDTQEVTKKDVTGRDFKEFHNTERIANVIVTLSKSNGELRRYDSHANQKEYENFLADHVEELMEEVHKRYNPLFDGDYTPYEKLFEHIHAPGVDIDGNRNKLYPEQKLRVAALTKLYQSGQTGGILEGDMGTGKTIMSLAVAALVSSKTIEGISANRSSVVVLSPNHLVKKWKREAESALQEFGVKAFVCTSVLDVKEAFAYNKGMKIIILGQQAAKNGAPWRPAFQTAHRLEINESSRRIEIDSHPFFRDEPFQERKIISVLICPTCGAEIDDESSARIQEMKSKTTYKYRESCLKCGGALWTEYPFKKGGRTALAAFINKHYPNSYFFINDEAQESKGGSTNIGYASRLLTTAARYSLFMTGTIYDGYASGLFHTAHRCLPHFRKLYGWNEVYRFVDHFGLRTVVTEYKPRYEMSTFGYRRLTGKRSSEAPGAAPGIVALLLSHTVFFPIEDIGHRLPKYKEFQMAVSVDGNDPARIQYDKNIQGKLKEEALKRTSGGDQSLLSTWLQASLGYLDVPEQGEVFESDTFHLEIPPVTSHVPEKDKQVIELMRAEIANGRRVLAYFSQVNRRDAMPRVAQKLEALGIKSAILRSKARHSLLPSGQLVKVRNYEREQFVGQALEQGALVLLTSPELVKTGLDLIEFPTIVYFGVTYKLLTVLQSRRRSWRLGQTKDVKVVFSYWNDSMQQAAICKLAAKTRASNLIHGEAISGLGSMEAPTGFLHDLVRQATGAERPDLPEYIPPQMPSAPIQIVKKVKPDRVFIEENAKDMEQLVMPGF